MTVLLAYAPTSAGMAAVRAAAEEAKRRGSEDVTIVSVLRTRAAAPPPDPISGVSAEQDLDAVADDLARQGLRVTVELRGPEMSSSTSWPLPSASSRPWSSSGCVAARRSGNCCWGPPRNGSCSSWTIPSSQSRRPTGVERRRGRLTRLRSRSSGSGAPPAGTRAPTGGAPTPQAVADYPRLTSARESV